MLIIYLGTNHKSSCDLDENKIEKNIFVLIIYFVNRFLSKKKNNHPFNSLIISLILF